MTTHLGERRDVAAAGQVNRRVSVLTDLRERLASPVAPYYLVLGSASLLVAIGLVMVLSASSVRSYVDSGSSWTVFLTQLLYAGIGVVLAVVGSRLRVVAWKRLAFAGMALAIALQALVFAPGVGVTFQGNRNWISVAGFTAQPSEFGKVALVVFGAAVLSRKRRVLGKIGHVLVPFVIPAAAVLIGLVLAGHDLGTALILLSITAGMLFAVGVRARWFVGVGGLAAVAAAVLASGSENRMQRIQAWVGDTCVNPQVTGCFQKVHAEYALADGGWWGVGLGASREKWSLLPEPHNDFILAIIGEELGLPGTFAVLGLFLVLAYSCYRIVAGTEDFFVRAAASGVMVWLLVQACLNIGSVIGLLPIIGVPLPLVSSGGSALLAALIGIGLLLSLARSLPGCREALDGRQSTLRRTLAVVPVPRGMRRR